MAKERLKMDMTTEDILAAMSGGHTGGLTVCVELMMNGEKIDPDDFAGGFSNIMELDSRGIHDNRIWNLYSVCGKHLGKMIAVLRACQLGIAGVNEETLNYAIDNNGRGLDLEVVVKAVQARLPQFKLDAAA